MPKIVAVDGPAGSGKSSICAEVCKRINWTYVNTGILYRAIAYLALENRVPLDDTEGLLRLVAAFEADYEWDPASGCLFFKSENVTEKLITREMGIHASRVGKNTKVRARLLPLQRELSLKSPFGSIVDGRDIGTVVFPDADLKVFMTASLEERARRRLAQLGGLGSLEDVQSEIASRDAQDKARGTAPLKQAQDSRVMDTSLVSMEEAIVGFLELLKTEGLLSSDS